MKKATLYFHYPCFDGLVSGVLAWEFLEANGWNITKLVPVDYGIRKRWLARRLNPPCAIVDFLYHPQSDFWADHHKTALLTGAAKASYERRKDRRWLFYDDRAPSCASLLYRHLRKALRHKPHFGELVKWAQKIDSADYSSVEEAVLGTAPALQINRSLLPEKGNSDYARFLMTELRQHDLLYVAGLKEVRQREQRVRRSLERGLKRVRARARVEEGEVVVVDARRNRNQMISRYAPYYVAPNARYSIGIMRTPDRIGITAMRNPWRKFRSIALGRALQEFGGGGHQRVGAVRLPAGQNKKVADVVQSLLSKMREPAR
jgi:hypothetical protein